MEEKPELVDVPRWLAGRERAARSGGFERTDFLHRLAAEEIAERLGDIRRQFADTLIVGSGGGAYATALAGRAGHMLQIEPSPGLAALAARAGEVRAAPVEPLPAAPGSFDLAVSGLWLHWAEDLVGALIQMRRALRPDGLMIAVLFGGATLAELRTSLAEAEAEVTGGLSPRVLPMAELRDLGAVLQRAGFQMPVADSLRVEATYPDAFALMRELRAMGEGNALAGRLKRPTGRQVMMRAAEIYAAHFPAEGGRVCAGFELVVLTGWSPGPDQPQPKRPGSATTRLADALGTVEIGAGEKARPR